MAIDNKTYDEMTEQLHNVIDPELGVSVVDLGLIYNLDMNDDEILIDMTLTYPGCPLTEIIESDINDALYGFNKPIKITWVWEPLWNTSMVSEEGKEMLTALGLYI